MTDPRISRLAQVLVNYSTEIREKELVAIIGRPHTTPLINEVHREVLRAGAYPYLMVRGYPFALPGLPGLDHILYSEANDDQLKHEDRFLKQVIEEFDGLIYIYSEYNTRSLSNIDPDRIKILQKTYQGIYKTYFERTASRDLRRVYTNFPVESLAQEADMSLQEYANFFYSATYCDDENPVRKWQEISQKQQRLADWLKGRNEVKIKGPDIDMVFSIEGRTFINGDGKVNMPCGEIYTGPVEDSANGWVRFTYPAIYLGKEVQSIKLRFENGKVVHSSAEKNEGLLKSLIDTDDGSCYLGEFGIGTNQKITNFMKDIMFDEKIKGTIHFALGAGYPESGSKNESSIHWDMICDLRDGGQIIIDDVLFFENDDFTV